MQELNTEQENKSLVEKAYDLALPFCAEGTVKTPAVKSTVWGKRKMPHSLGHGMGLQIHEAPWIRTKIRVRFQSRYDEA